MSSVLQSIRFSPAFTTNTQYVLARNDDAEFELPIILGLRHSLIAHEIGHLLLGPNGHSSGGIMQPQWEPRQVRHLMMGTLLFTTEQAKLMRAQARTRIRAQAASVKE